MLLIKEQVEELGWKYHPDSFARKAGLELTHYWFTKDGYGLTVNINNDRVSITDDREQTIFPNFVFNGSLNSVEQLKSLMEIFKIAG